jgi:hypothetical protein
VHAELYCSAAGQPVSQRHLLGNECASSEALGTSHEAHVRATGATPLRGMFIEMRGKSPAPYLQTKVGTADEEGPAT